MTRAVRTTLVLLTLTMAVLGLPLLAAAQEVTIALAGEPTTLDPQKATDRLTSIITTNIFDSLTFRDKDMKIQPGLATSFKRLNDRTWQFQLREGVKFHNGEPFDAAAVKFSIDRILNPETKSPMISYVNTIEKVEIINPMTVNITTKAPDPLLLYRVGELHGQIMPPRYLKEKGDVEFGKLPVGTGPYKVERFVKNDRLVLVANEAYWRGAPRVKRLTLRPVTEDATRMAMILSGEADLATNVPPVQAASLKASGRVAIESVTTPRLFYVVIDTSKPPFTDKRVRQALNYAIDVPTIIQKVFMGYGKRVATYVGMQSFGYDPSVQPYPYDPERAKKLLAEAGYPNGFSVTFDSFTGSLVDPSTLSEAVTGYLEKVGIKVSLNVEEFGIFAKRRLANNNNPLSIYSFGDVWLDADLPLKYMMQGKLGHYYANPPLKEKIDEAGRIFDEAKRRAIYSDVQKTLKEEAPKIFLLQYEAIFAVGPRVKYAPRADEILWFYDLAMAK